MGACDGNHAHNDKERWHTWKEAMVASKEHPVLIDRYMVGMEVEVDTISNELCMYPQLWNKSSVPLLAGVHSVTHDVCSSTLESD